jgi:hypothetical protein
MKPLALVALNVVVVGVALVAYDVLRNEPAVDTTPRERAAAAAPDDDPNDVLERLRTLEMERRRVRRGATDPEVLARLDALEAALGAPTSEPAATVPTELDAGAVAATDPEHTGEWQPTQEEVRRFRTLMEAVRHEEAIDKNRQRIDAALDGLPVTLSDREREGVHRAYAAFRPRVNEIWGEAKDEARRTVEAGGTIDRETLVTDTTAVIQQEFAETLSSVVSRSDAVTISEALMAGGK